jgi:hypothetical protein
MRHVYDLEIMDRMRFVGSITDTMMGKKPDISDVVYHFKCTKCGKKKKIVVANNFVEPATGKTQLDMVIENGNKCISCCLSEIPT